MSRNTSTAALDTFRQRFLRNPRRVPRHPAGEKITEIRQAQLAVFQEEDMRSANQKWQTASFRSILPGVLRVAFSRFLWTLGARMHIAAAQTNEHFASGDRVHPFTALVSQATFLPGSQIPVDTQMKTFAARSDGSIAELLHRMDPSDIEKTLYIKRITDAPGKRLVVVDPFSESITTYPHEPAAVAYHAAKPVSVCDGKPAGQQLGYSVDEADQTLGPEDTGGHLDEIRIKLWLAPALNCTPVRRITILTKDGSELERTVESFINIVEGEPDPMMFEIPSEYVERTPSEAMAEAVRRYPKAEGFDCGGCNTKPKDFH